MLSFFFAILPWFFTLFIYRAWYNYLQRRELPSLIHVFIYAFVLTLSQIISTSLVFGLFGVYSWYVVYSANLVFSLMLYWKYRHNLPGESSSVISTLKRTSLWSKVFLSVLVVIIFSRVVLVIVINDVSFDAMNYHLAWAGHAIQEQHLGPFETPVPWINSYPKNLALFYSWFILAPVHDVFVDGAQLLFSLLGVASIYLLLRKFYSLEISLICSSLYLFLPVVLLQSTTNYIDIALASLVFTLVLVASEGQTKLSIILFALLSGILIGSKATMLIPVFFTAILLLYSLYNQEEIPFGNLIRGVGVIGLIIFSLAGYWYIRNLLVYGDLLYPLKVVIAGVTIIPGVIDSTALVAQSIPETLRNAGFFETLFKNSYEEGVARYDMAPGGFGPLWAWVLVPSMVIALIRWIITKQYYPLMLFMGFWLTFLLTPGNWWFRYVVLFIFAGFIALAEVLKWLTSSRGAFHSFVALVYVTSVFSLSTAFFPYYFEQESIGQRDFAHRFGDIYNDIAVASDSGAKIAYDSSWFVIYPLWNETRSNAVVHIPMQKNWYTLLMDSEVEYLVVKSDSPEYQYIQLQSDKFTEVSNTGIYFLYQL